MKIIPQDIKDQIIRLRSEGVKGKDIKAITGVSIVNIFSIINRSKNKIQSPEFFDEHEHENWIV